MEFVFELIVNFMLAVCRIGWPAVSAAHRLQIPAPALEQDDEAHGEFHFVGEVVRGSVAVRIGPGDAPDDATGAGGSD